MWHLLGDRPRLSLALALTLEAVMATLVCRVEKLEPTALQFLLGEQEIVATHRIQSTFLPIGYAAALGWSAVLGGAHATAAIFAMQIAVLLVIVALARAILLEFGSARFATTAALLIGLHPQVLNGVRTINDPNFTLAVLLAILLTALRLRREPSVLNAIAAGVAIGCATLVRPNLALMALLLLWAVYRLPFAQTASKLLLAAAAIALVYGGVTALVHGSPFFPHNGPYNLYAGYNDYSEAFLLKEFNAEDSIPAAMAADGLHAHLNWYVPSDQPGVDDVRDERYESYYQTHAMSYIVDHPGGDIRLDLIKLLNFFRPDYTSSDRHRSHRAHLLTVAYKWGALTLFPLWVGLLAYSRVKHLRLGCRLIVWMTVLYVLPFVLTNSDPRFRVALEGVILLDIARMAFAMYRRGSWRGYTVGSENNRGPLRCSGS
jgi:4-amino-4-deoxy-L-arabinose transferase-like glycosyltransferase